MVILHPPGPALGMRVEVAQPDPATIRADPDWPGEEMPRTALPVVIGRAGHVP